MSSLAVSRGPLSASTERERGSTVRKATKDRAVTDIREDYKKFGAPLPSKQFLEELQKRTKAIRVLQLDYESSSDEDEENDEILANDDDEQKRLLEQFQKQLSSTQMHIADKKSKRELEKEKKQQKKEAKKEEKKRERERRKEKKRNGSIWGSLTTAFSSKDKHQKEDTLTKSRSPSIARKSPCASPPSTSSQKPLPARSPGSSQGSSRGSYIAGPSSRPLTQTEIVQTIKKLHALNTQMGTIKKQRKEQTGSSIEPSPKVPLEEQFYPVQRRKSESAIIPSSSDKKNVSPLSSEIKPNTLKTSTDNLSKKNKRPPSLITTPSPTSTRNADAPKALLTQSEPKVLSVPSDDFKETPLSDVPSPPSVTSSEDVETISPLCSSPTSSIVRDTEEPLEDFELAKEMTISDAKQLLDQLKCVPNLAEQLQDLSTQGQLPDFETTMLDDLRCDLESLSAFDALDDSRDLAALGFNLDLGTAEDVLDNLPLPNEEEYYVNPDDVELCLKGKQLQVFEQIGKGASATVWKGSVDGQFYALKTISLVGVKNRKIMRRMLRDEVNMMKCFKHPNVIRYYGLFYAKDTQEVNIVLELIEGGSLTKLIEEKGKFSDKVAATITYQILNGLAFLHSNLIIHRDLKPDNMLLSDGQIKLIDFGTSTKVLEFKTCRRSTVGTPWYTAPEVINAEEYSFPADIWSLGCLVFELLTGKPPFHDLNPVACLFKMASEDPEIPESLSPSAKSFLKSCWNREWKDRPTPSQLLKHQFLLEHVNPRDTKLTELLK